MVDELDRWCSQILGLQKVADKRWIAETATAVSFPVDDQIELAQIEDQSYWFQHRNDVITSIIKRFPPTGPIIDVGGGNGFVSKALLQHNFSALVVEPGPLAVQKCVERGVPVVQAAFQDIEVPPRSTHAVGLFDVLEHIEDDSTALTRFHDILTQGGLLYISVPAYQWLWSREDVDGGHFRRYTLTTLRNKLESAGFAIEFETHMFSALVLPLLLLRALPSKLGIREGRNIDQSAREHSLPANYFGRLLTRSFVRERVKINCGNSLMIGTSCLIVARRTKY